MFRILRSVVVMTAASITAGVLAAPGAAYATDTTTKLSAASLAAELKAVSAASTAASKNGWKATMGMRWPDGLQITGLYVADPAGGIATAQIRARGGDAGRGKIVATYAAVGRGLYEYNDSPKILQAVKMMRRPAVRYVFTPKAVKLNEYAAEYMPQPGLALAPNGKYPGTKTVHDGGSTDYAYQDQIGMTNTVRVSSAGALTSARATDLDVTLTVAFTYGPQRVTLPAPAVTVDAKSLAAAVAYLTMPESVKGVADRGAAATRRAAKGKPVNVASLRTIVRREAVASNTSTKVNMIKVNTIGAGIRVSGTNPWTRATVSYTVTASGSKVIVAKS